MKDVKSDPGLAEFHTRLSSAIARIADGYLRLEHHLGEIAGKDTRPDLALLQSFDRLTQELREISGVLNRAQAEPSADILNWNEVLAGIRLETMRQALEGDRYVRSSADEIDLF